MGASYHQFCPVAKAMELLDERWTMLVLRELISGSRHFNDLRRGLPTMSPTLLSKRLQQLVRAGLVSRTEDELLEVRNFGETTLKEVRQKLAEHGLTLGMRLPAGRR